jgi:hypothetical protein
MSRLQTKWIEDNAVTFDKLNEDVKSVSTDLSVDSGKLVNRETLQKVLDNFQAGLDVQEDILGVQVDIELDPGMPSAGDRYVIGNAAQTHPAFGAIADIEDGDIVEYDGGTFVVMYDVSVREGSTGSAIVWNRGTGEWLMYSDTGWRKFGGLSGVTAGDGLVKSGDVMSVNLKEKGGDFY